MYENSHIFQYAMPTTGELNTESDGHESRFWIGHMVEFHVGFVYYAEQKPFDPDVNVESRVVV